MKEHVAPPGSAQPYFCAADGSLNACRFFALSAHKAYLVLAVFRETF